MAGMRNSARCPTTVSRRSALAGLCAWPLAGGATTLPGLTPPAVLGALQGSGLPLASFGVYVRPVDSPKPVVSLNAEQPFMLASTAKLVTSLAALDVLGPRYRWRTHAFAAGDIDAGRLLGDLLIVGGGDPTLSTTELREWMLRMRAQGLNEVRGDIVLDRSAFRFENDDHADTPEPAPDRPHHVRPDALTLDEGVLHVNVQPARSGLADVQPVPSLAGVRLVNKVSAGRGCSAHARWAEDNGQPQLWVEGHWGSGCGQGQLSLVPPGDSRYFGRAVAALWRDVGGRLLGRVREDRLPVTQRDGARMPLYGLDGEAMFPWCSHFSEFLPEVIRDINKTSNNLAARHLMLSLSRGFPMRPATRAGAQDTVRQWLARQGLAAGDIEIDNGSGLSRAERGKPRALVQLLCNAWTAREARSFLDSLPIAGVDGTLAHRMEGGFATGHAYLKTGTLFDTRALAGYVRGRSGRVYAVSALLNHPAAASGRPALDAIIEWLARHG